MRVILVYDIATDEPSDQVRLSRVRKVTRRYLHSVQKSVFEGSITESRLEKLKRELLQILDRKRDSVIIYVLSDLSTYERHIITDAPDPTDNVL